MRDPVETFRQFSHVRESEGPNRGHYVDSFNEFARAPLGSSWCASVLCFVLWTAKQGDPGLPISAACEDLHQAAVKAGMIVTTPQAGDVFLRIDPATGAAHHTGMVTQVSPLTAIAGNTSEDGASSNGTGVFEHPLSTANTVFVRPKYS